MIRFSDKKRRPKIYQPPLLTDGKVISLNLHSAHAAFSKDSSVFAGISCFYGPQMLRQIIPHMGGVGWIGPFP